METVVKNPDLLDKFQTDSKGRINLGKEWSNQTVIVAVGKPDRNDNNG